MLNSHFQSSSIIFLNGWVSCRFWCFSSWFLYIQKQFVCAQSQKFRGSATRRDAKIIIGQPAMLLITCSCDNVIMACIEQTIVSQIFITFRDLSMLSW